MKNRSDLAIWIGFGAGVVFTIIMIVLWYSPYHNERLTVALATLSCAEFILAYVYAFVDYLEAKAMVKKELES